MNARRPLQYLPESVPRPRRRRGAPGPGRSLCSPRAVRGEALMFLLQLLPRQLSVEYEDAMMERHRAERELRVLAKGRRVEARLQQRALVVLLAAEGLQNKDIAVEAGLDFAAVEVGH